MYTASKHIYTFLGFPHLLGNLAVVPDISWLDVLRRVELEVVNYALPPESLQRKTNLLGFNDTKLYIYNIIIIIYKYGVYIHYTYMFLEPLG